MSKFYLIIDNEHKAVGGYQKGFLTNLMLLNPSIKVEQVAIITAPDELDCLFRAIDACPVVGPAPVAVQVTPAIPAPEKKGKKPRLNQPTGTCKQCKKDRPLTKSGICKICAMANARAARKNGQQAQAGYVGKEEIKANRTARTEEHIITRHGPIRARKLG